MSMPITKSKPRPAIADEPAASAEPNEEAPVAGDVSVGAAPHAPKYTTYDVKLSLLLTDEHLEYLEKVVREIMRNRRVKHERITKNTVMRCLVDLLKALPLDVQEIPDEAELRRRVLAAARI